MKGMSQILRYVARHLKAENNISEEAFLMEKAASLIDKQELIINEGQCRLNCRNARQWFESGWNMRADLGLGARCDKDREEAYQHCRNKEK